MYGSYADALIGSLSGVCRGRALLSSDALNGLLSTVYVEEEHQCAAVEQYCVPYTREPAAYHEPV
jgi:hypothetical protein